MERQKLTLRLQAVYDEALKWRISEYNGRLIDVGSDHGFVSLEGLITGDYDFVIATDIHENPAAKTAEILIGNGYKDKSQVVCTDGLDGVELSKGDVVIMAGLGGNNMMDILECVLKVTPEDVLQTVTWCLQPQKTIEELRVFLEKNGFRIKDDIVVHERNIYYPITLAIYEGGSRELGLYEKYYGPVMIKRFTDGEDIVKEYFSKLDEWYKVRARGDEEIRQLMEKIEDYRK